jgi:hypothetical protein
MPTTFAVLSEELFRHLADGGVLGTRILRFGSTRLISVNRGGVVLSSGPEELGGLDYADQVAVTAKAREARHQVG